MQTRSTSYSGSLIYALFQIGQGLLLHPYQTMQSLVRERVFIWMTLTPSALLAGVTIVWRFGIVPLVQQFITCTAVGGWCLVVDFAALWVIYFCFYWQVLLLYLAFRFRWGYR